MLLITPGGGHDTSRALRMNSRVLLQSLSFCRRSGVGGFWRPALLPWCRLPVLLSFLAAYCHSLAATVVGDSSHNLVYRDVVMDMQ